MLTSKTELKLQRLDVGRENFDDDDDDDREWYQPLRALLEWTSDELRSLKIDCSNLFEGLYQDNYDWNPSFPQLEILEIGGGVIYDIDRSDSKRKEVTR